MDQKQELKKDTDRVRPAERIAESFNLTAENVEKIFAATNNWVDQLKRDHTMLGCLMCEQDFDCATAVAVSGFNMCPSCASQRLSTPSASASS